VFLFPNQTGDEYVMIGGINNIYKSVVRSCLRGVFLFMRGYSLNRQYIDITHLQQKTDTTIGIYYIKNSQAATKKPLQSDMPPEVLNLVNQLSPVNILLLKKKVFELRFKIVVWKI
jgi:hypothetical protein